MRKLLLLFLLLCCPVESWATANLQVPIEILDTGVASNTASSTTFQRTQIKFDTTDYDGVSTYDFEIVAKNTDSTNKNITLIDSTSTTVATCTVTTSMSSTSGTRVRCTFSPNSGADTYRVVVPATTTVDDVRVYCARLLVTQVNATKTRIQIPLVQVNEATASESTTSLIDTSVSASYVQPSPDKYSLWRRNDAAFGTVTGYDFEATYRTQSSANTASISLFNATDNLQVTGSELTHTGNTTTVCELASFAGGAANFLDAKNYEVRIKVSGGSGVDLFRAALYVKLSPVTIGEIYYRYVRYRVSIVATASVGRQRILITDGDFSSPAYFHEATGRESAAGTVTDYLKDGTTTDTGTTGSDVSGSGITFASTTKSRVRTSALTLTSGDRFLSDINRTSGTEELTSGWLVVSISAPSSPVPIIVNRRRRA